MTRVSGDTTANTVTAGGMRFELRWYGSVRQARQLGAETWRPWRGFKQKDANQLARAWFKLNCPLIEMPVDTYTPKPVFSNRLGRWRPIV